MTTETKFEEWDLENPPFGLGTRWGLHIYACGTSVSEPCEPLKYVTGRSFNFFFLRSLIMSRIPSQIKESTIWYESWRDINDQYLVKLKHEGKKLRGCDKKKQWIKNSPYNQPVALHVTADAEIRWLAWGKW